MDLPKDKAAQKSKVCAGAKSTTFAQIDLAAAGQAAQRQLSRYIRARVYGRSAKIKPATPMLMPIG